MDATVDFSKNGSQRGHLRIPHSAHRSAYGHIPVPIAVLKNGEGPTALLVGGIHGDEYEGPVALSKFVQKVNVDNVHGTIIVLPALNYPAFLAASRVSPIDGINLNRTFPGRRDGTVTEVIADYVTRVLLPLTDYVFDCHAGGSSLQYLPSMLAPLPGQDEEGRKLNSLLAAIAPERLLYFDGSRALSGEDRVIGNYAAKNGATYLSGEYGGGGFVSPDGVGMVERCLARFLAHIEAINSSAVKEYCGAAAMDRPVSQEAYRMDDPSLFLYAHRPGFFEPAFRLGDMAEEGQIAGYIYDRHDLWATPAPVRFESSGLCVCQRNFAQVEVGDCLGHLARPV